MGVFEDSISTFLAPVKDFLFDPTVTEILINGPSEIFIERRGFLSPIPTKFHDEHALQAAVRNIAQFVGKKIDEENPILEARLPDGSRIQAVLPPCSRKGTIVAIRKFSNETFTFNDIITRGSLTKDAARFLDICVFLAKNIIVSGGTGSGKTSLLNILGSRVPPHQRTLVVEDSSELKIKSAHVVTFESRPPNAEGKGAVSIRDLLKASLRLRPDRIVVGEVRGGEALDLVTAMNTGHGGSMGTVHANSPVDSLIRLETLAMIGDARIPEIALRRQIVSAIHLIVQTKRLDDGSRKVTEISEVVPDITADGRYQVRDLYKFVMRGRTQDRKIIGELIAVGNLPSFYSEIELHKIPFPKEKFTSPDWYDEIKAKSGHAA